MRWLVVLVGATIAALFWTGLAARDLGSPARSALGVTAVAVGLWGAEIVSLPTTALLGVALLFVSGAVPTMEQALVGFASPVLYFLLGSAALGIAAEQSGLADRLARWLLARSRGSGRRLLLELQLSLPLQALIMPSAISRNAVLVPVYERVLARVDRPQQLGAGVMLTLGVLGPLASSALLTGGTSPVAASQLLGGFTWVSWLVALAPPYYVLLAAGAAAVWMFTPPERETVIGERIADEVHGPLCPAEWLVAFISMATAVLWMLDQVTHWPPAVPALLAMVVLVCPSPIGVMPWSAFAARAPWGTGFVLAAAVSLADALSHTGAAAWLAGALFDSLPGVVGGHAALMAIAVFLVTAVVTLAIPNRAAAITLGIPLATAFAATGALDTTAAGLIVMIAVDAETIYPAQTAANLLAYERGYFGAGVLARFNLVTLTFAALGVVLVALPWWSFVGLPHGG